MIMLNNSNTNDTELSNPSDESIIIIENVFKLPKEF